MSATDPETISAATDENLDRIEREIAIEATAERVWQLVSEPGWYVNDSVITDHRIDRDGDSVDGARSGPRRLHLSYRQTR